MCEVDVVDVVYSVFQRIAIRGFDTAGWNGDFGIKWWKLLVEIFPPLSRLTSVLVML
jgi:hypothetical protein